MDIVVTVIQCAASVATAVSLYFIIQQTRANKKSIDYLAEQTQLLKHSYEYTSDWQEKDKSCQLALFYKENILPRIGYITSVFNDTGALDELSVIRDADIREFTETELFSLAGDKIMDKIKKIFLLPKNVPILLLSRRDLAQKADIKLIPIRKEDLEENENLTTKLLANEMFVIVSETLNLMEYFSMQFVSKVADEATVYPSLHQTYLKIVSVLYFAIAAQNKHPKDKYYTNVIALYHKWCAKDTENMKRTNDAICSPECVKK